MTNMGQNSTNVTDFETPLTNQV